MILGKGLGLPRLPDRIQREPDSAAFLHSPLCADLGPKRAGIHPSHTSSFIPQTLQYDITADGKYCLHGRIDTEARRLCFEVHMAIGATDVQVTEL